MILASQSPRRIELMREAGYDIRVIPADIDETPFDDEAPLTLVERLARAKAAAVAAEHADPSELTIAADTIVTFDGKILGKPANEDEARTMLHELSGRTHQVATGVCIVRSGDVTAPHAAESLSFVDVTDVTFYELTDEQIERYVASGEPMDKAGAYGIQASAGACSCTIFRATSTTWWACPSLASHARFKNYRNCIWRWVSPTLQFRRTVRIPTGHKARRKTDRSKTWIHCLRPLTFAMSMAFALATIRTRRPAPVAP